jgi:hypothetical protein
MSNDTKRKSTIIDIFPTNWISTTVSVLSAMVSWYFNKSIGWAILHFLFGWIYLLYSLLLGRFADGGFMEIINSYF